MTSDADAIEKPADGEERGRSERAEAFDAEIEVGGRDLIEFTDKVAHPSGVMNGRSEEQEHGKHHENGLRGIGPDRGPQATAHAVDENEPGSDAGSGRGVPVEEGMEGFAAGIELGRSVNGEENERDDSDGDLEGAIMTAVPFAEKFRETERARLFRGFAEFFMNHAEGDEVAKEESAHQPDRREPVTVNVSDQPDEHVAAVFRGGSRERGEKRRDCPSGEKVIVFLVRLLAGGPQTDDNEENEKEEKADNFHH